MGFRWKRKFWGGAARNWRKGVKDVREGQVLDDRRRSERVVK